MFFSTEVELQSNAIASIQTFQPTQPCCSHCSFTAAKSSWLNPTTSTRTPLQGRLERQDRCPIRAAIAHCGGLWEPCPHQFLLSSSPSPLFLFTFSCLCRPSILTLLLQSHRNTHPLPYLNYFPKSLQIQNQFPQCLPPSRRELLNAPPFTPPTQFSSCSPSDRDIVASLLSSLMASR